MVRLDTVCFLVILCLLVLYHRSGLRGIIVKCICLDLMCQFCFMCLVSFVNHNTVICHITYSRNIVLHFLPTKRVAWSMGIVLHCIYTLLASILCISFLSLFCQYLYLFNCHDLASSPSVGLLQTSFLFFYGCFLIYHYLVVANVVELGLPYIVTIYDFSNLFRENTKEYHVFLTENFF